jgi:excisionase family DNA binding protein
MSNELLPALQLLAYTIEEAAEVARSSRSVIYQEIAAERLLARKIGRRVVILHQDLMAWLMALPRVEMRQAS